MAEPITMTFDKASGIVEALTASDQEWSYKLVPVNKNINGLIVQLWAIEVYDEEGIYVSTFHKSESDE